MDGFRKLSVNSLLLLSFTLGAITATISSCTNTENNHNNTIKGMEEDVISETEKDSTLYIHHKTMVDPDGNEINLVYRTYTTPPTVNLSYGPYNNIRLEQTTAWSKGAEYENNDIKWSTTPDGGTLEADGKKTEFKYE